MTCKIKFLLIVQYYLFTIINTITAHSIVQHESLQVNLEV